VWRTDGRTDRISLPIIPLCNHERAVKAETKVHAQMASVVCNITCYFRRWRKVSVRRSSVLSSVYVRSSSFCCRRSMENMYVLHSLCIFDFVHYCLFFIKLSYYCLISYLSWSCDFTVVYVTFPFCLSIRSWFKHYCSSECSTSTTTAAKIDSTRFLNSGLKHLTQILQSQYKLFLSKTWGWNTDRQ